LTNATGDNVLIRGNYNFVESYPKAQRNSIKVMGSFNQVALGRNEAFVSETVVINGDDGQYEFPQ
jgi:hypothetical protein